MEPLARLLATSLLAAAALLPFGAAQAQSQGAGLSNLFGGLFSGPKPDTAPQPATLSGPLPWSGEDGASGNPLMTAAAIRAAAANFPTCIEKLWPLAARRGVSRASFERLTAHLAPDLRIMDLLDSQPEFTKAVWDYLDVLVNDNRIAKGRAVLAKYSGLPQKIVDRIPLPAYDFKITTAQLAVWQKVMVEQGYPVGKLDLNKIVVTGE